MRNIATGVILLPADCVAQLSLIVYVSVASGGGFFTKRVLESSGKCLLLLLL